METTLENAKAGIKKAFAVTVAVAGAIRELGSVPAGTAYAHLMGHLSLEQFDAIIAVLVKQGLVRREPNHLLVWTGPVK